MEILTPTKFTLMFLAFFLCSNFLSAQDQGKLVTLKKGKIFTTDGNLIGFQMLRQTDDKFFYQNITGEFIGIPKSEINLIKKQNGSHAFRFGLTSGASAIFGYFIGSAVSNKQVSVKTKKNGFIISALSGTLFGLIYGSTKKKYSTIYKSDSPKQTFGQLKLEVTSPNEISSLGLVYSF